VLLLYSVVDWFTSSDLVINIFSARLNSVWAERLIGHSSDHHPLDLQNSGSSRQGESLSDEDCSSLEPE
jgi:hypothetical protein